MSEPAKRIVCALGVFFTLLGLYLLTNPGRIDFIDGQYRYEVARSWLDVGEPVIRDPALLALGAAVNPSSGKAYSGYNAGPSLTPAPLMALSRWLPGGTADRDRFAFSLTGAFFGALVPVLLMTVYGRLGVGLPMSVACALVFGLTTQWWPGSVTSFDQNQHAFLLLSALLLAWRSGRHASAPLAAMAGVTGSLLLTYQETYAILLPAVALAVFAPASEGTPCAAPLGKLRIDRGAVIRYLAFGAGSCVGVGLFLAFNYWRFGALLQPDRYQALWPDNGLAGALSLTISPGRSVFLFSPPLVLAAFGARAVWTRAPALSFSAGLSGVMHLLFVSNLAFFAGEWAWGPRYLLVLLPLASLGLPFAMVRLRARYAAVPLAVGLGLLVQLMAVSLDHQRFYFERNLAPHFWAYDPWFYFKDSQLLARPLELAETLRSGVPAEARSFSPTPRSQVTYAPFGPARPHVGAAWVQGFQVFYLPRPWPLWMTHMEPATRPTDVAPLTGICVALMVLGIGLPLLALLKPTVTFKASVLGTATKPLGSP